MVVHGFVPEATGGVELRCYYLAREMARNHRVSVFTRSGDPDVPDYDVRREQIDGIEVTRVNYNFSDCEDFRDIYLNPRIEALFAKHLDEIRPDVVHIHHLTCLTTSIPELLRSRDVPTVASLHDFWLSCPRGQVIRTDLSICDPIDRSKCVPCLAELWPHFPWPSKAAGASAADDLAFIMEYDAHIRGVLETPDRLFAPCDSHREKFIRLGAPADRIQTMAYGFDRAMYDGVAERRAPSERVRFGFIGSMIPPKGVHVLLEAFEGIDPATASLDLYGEQVPFHGDPSYLERIDRAAKANPAVRLHGRYENRELPDILSRVDVLVVPSVWYETFSITIREGFMAGIPVVASRLGAMEEAFEDGVSGLHFEPGDARDLRRQLVRLIEQPALRERLAAAPKTVKGIAENAAEIVAIYRDLAREKGAAR